MTFTRTPDGFSEISTRCRECGETFVLKVPSTKLDEWNSRDCGHVQAFWPELSASERELHFMSGICGTCWDRLFEPESDEEGGM